MEIGMNLLARMASLLVAGALTAGFATLASPAAGSAKDCSGYADPLNRSKSFWTRARAEQVQACIAQFGTAARSKNRVTPLYLAALFSSNPVVFAALLKGGADPNAKAKNGFTPLHAAAQHNGALVVAALLKGGAVPNAKDKDGWTPLHLAAKSSRTPAVFIALLTAGADSGARNIQGATPLHVAAQENRNPAVVAALVEGGADPNAKARNGVTPLHAAAQHNGAPVVAALLEGGADPKNANRGGFTPLHVAAQHNSAPAVVTALLKAGADPDSRNLQGATPLHMAAWKNSNPAIVAALLKAGADPNAKARNGGTPLHAAAQENRNPAVVAALVKGGADPNAKARNGVTPLHVAALKNSNPAVLSALLKAGADPAMTYKGKTAFDLARNNEKLAGSAAYRQFQGARKTAGAAGGATRLTRADYRTVQRLLNEHGFAAGPEDGQWGPRSRRALRAFQAREGLGRTGAPDAVTLRALGFLKTAKSGTRRIPVAPELGWVEVERRHSAGGLGWQCDTPGHLRRVLEVQQGTFSDTEPIDGLVWNRAARIYLLKRLTEHYPARGKPGLESRDRSFSWRGWLRGTLERINTAADEAGMPQRKKNAALLFWVMCHISLTEAARIRDLILAAKKEGE